MATGTFVFILFIYLLNISFLNTFLSSRVCFSLTSVLLFSFFFLLSSFFSFLFMSSCFFGEKKNRYRVKPDYQVSLVNRTLGNTIPACVVSGWHATSFNPSGDQIEGLKPYTTHMVRVRVAYDFDQYIKSMFLRAGVGFAHPTVGLPSPEPLRSKWSTSLQIDTAPASHSDNTLEGYDVKEESEATFQRLVDDLLASDHLSSRAHALMNLTTFVSLAAAAECAYPSLGERLVVPSSLGKSSLWISRTKRAFCT